MVAALDDANRLLLPLVLTFCRTAKPCKAVDGLFQNFLPIDGLPAKIKEPHLPQLLKQQQSNGF